MAEAESLRSLPAAEVRRRIESLLASDASDAERLAALEALATAAACGGWQPLDDDTADRLYERFPHLLRGPFKMHVAAGWPVSYPRLIERAIAAGDDSLVDFLASRMVARAAFHWRWSKADIELAERLSRHYEPLRDDDDAFARRAVAVLRQVPAHSIGSYRQLVRTNRLARMFYERSTAKYLAFPAGIRELLAAPEVHTQALAFRVLGLDDDAARRLAVENIDLLLNALLCPLCGRTRLLALRAAENGAVTAEIAERVHRRCREALDLPDKRDPKERLVGLIGRLLRRWPELRGPREVPLVYGGANGQPPQAATAVRSSPRTC